MKDFDRPKFNSEDIMDMPYLSAIPDSEEVCLVSASEILEFEIAAYSVPLVPLPASLKSRLMARLQLPEFNISPEFQRLLLKPIKSLIRIANTIKIWQPLSTPEGSTYAKWKVDVNNRQVAFFLRVPTAGALQSHRHATGETVLVLEGDFICNGITYKPGDRSVSEAKTIHQPTTHGCLVLCISSLDDEEIG